MRGCRRRRSRIPVSRRSRAPRSRRTCRTSSSSRRTMAPVGTRSQSPSRSTRRIGSNTGTSERVTLATVYLLGHPVAHSLSPAMHNAAFLALGLPHRYETRDVEPDRLEDFVEALRKEDVLGANVTIPHKERPLRIVDQHGLETQRRGTGIYIQTD